VRVLPQNDPTASLRVTTLRYVLPPPQAELAALERAADALAPGKEDLSLNALLDLYDDALTVRDERKRTLIAPIELPPDVVVPLPGQGGWLPVFCRLLRSSHEVSDFAEHLRAIAPSLAGRQIDEKTTLGELRGLLAHPDTIAEYSLLVANIDVPVGDLFVVFQHLFALYAARRPRFALVLILDQFEEIFTRFVEKSADAETANSPPSPGGEMPDWRLRPAFFSQLGALRAVGALPTGGPPDEASPQTPLPICYVISMRDEFIAELDQLRHIFPTAQESAYHLRLLEKKQAEAAVREPARLFDYTYSGACFASIIGQLVKEDRYVEPAHLQIICEKLWNDQGKEMAARQDQETIPQIELAAFEGLGGAQGILRSFLRDFLQALDSERHLMEARLETLEILALLLTPSKTRNIVPRDQIVGARFRDPIRRKYLLDRLVNRTLVRTEPRLGGYFVEITHEFLISPILEAVNDAQSAHRDYFHFVQSVHTLVANAREGFEVRSAVVALGLIGEPESIQQLVEIALRDPDETVRKQAEEEILHLSGAPQRQALEALASAMQDPQAARSAYLLLAIYADREPRSRG
jgi:hypothetical protein